MMLISFPARDPGFKAEVFDLVLIYPAVHLCDGALDLHVNSPLLGLAEVAGASQKQGFLGSWHTRGLLLVRDHPLCPDTLASLLQRGGRVVRVRRLVTGEHCLTDHQPQIFVEDLRVTMTVAPDGLLELDLARPGPRAAVAADVIIGLFELGRDGVIGRSLV